MNSELLLVNFDKYPIGKFIGSNKIRYLWEFDYKKSSLEFEILYSKTSKTFRLFFNQVSIFEERSIKSDFSFSLVIDQMIFVFKRIVDAISFEINDLPFESFANHSSYIRKKKFSTYSNSKTYSFTNSEMERNLYNTADQNKQSRFGIFEFEIKERVCLIKQGNNFGQTSNQFYINTTTQNGGNNEEPKNSVNQKYKYLDDSNELYIHDFKFLFTGDVDEDYEMIEKINSIKPYYGLSQRSAFKSNGVNY